jgi:transposase
MFRKEAYEILLEKFRPWARDKLRNSKAVQLDETGIKGPFNWIHLAADPEVGLHMPYEKRGVEAMDDTGIIAWPDEDSVACHGHWKPYCTCTDCEHSLCTAHIFRELLRAEDSEGISGRRR